MKRSIPSILLILFLYPGFVGYAGQPTASLGRIYVEVAGLRNDSGEVRVNLYNSKDGFPSEPKKSFMTLASRIEKSEARVVFKDVPYGEYAIAVLHDENGNKRMDFNWLNIPIEGAGASNNPKAFFGPPSYSSSRFRLDSEDLTVRIKVRY